jgi:hypothetical protein
MKRCGGAGSFNVVTSLASGATDSAATAAEAAHSPEPRAVAKAKLLSLTLAI